MTALDTVSIPQIPTAQELVDRAIAMIPRLRETMREHDRLGRISDEAIAMLRDAGFFRILQPKAFGGYEMHPSVFLRVLHQVARGAPAAGWVLMVIGVHNWEVALLGERVANELWGVDPDIRVSSSYVPFGDAKKVDGGYELSGRWKFSSGCDHCDWAFLGGWVDLPEGEREYRVFLVSRQDYAIDDKSWNTFGLQGTGSKDLLLEKAFVPDHRTHAMRDSLNCDNVGLKDFTASSYKYPFGTLFSFGVVSAIIGMAMGARDVYLEGVRGKRASFTGAELAQDGFVVQTLAAVDADIQACLALLDRMTGEIDADIDANIVTPVERRAQYMAYCAEMGGSAVDAVVRLFRRSGARAIALNGDLQQYVRDILAGGNHITMDAVHMGANAGAVTLGAPNQVAIL
ncbi:flavin-dependent monooxygenase [Sphingobium estronivorans]|uniref:flavin-dependent monooxygenase n=1 Tax=Sphingobium estronivorans TaxID=1577690 RepID=UPI00123AB034|nr:flavin-dependent monooxygenase [Sphingobium estronivorans]